MGGGGSKKLDQRFHAAIDNPERIRRFTAKLNITQGEVEKFFKIFDKMDKDKSGEISIDEFFDIFGLDWSSFGRQIFTAMDVSGDNSVEFVEFFVGLWNYCTLDDKNLVKFAFDLFDSDGGGTIDVGEFKELISMIHGSKAMDSQAEKLLKVFDKDKSGAINFQEFSTNVKKTPSLLMDAYTLQRKMRESVMGLSYWTNATARRKQNTVEGSDLVTLYYSLYGQSDINREENKKKAQGEKIGVVKFKKMTPKSKVGVFSDPASGDGSRRVSKLAPNEYVVIVETIETKGEIWYNIKGDEGTGRKGGWVAGKYIEIEEEKPDEET